MTPDVASQLPVHAAIQPDRISKQSIPLKDRLLLTVPLPVGCYLMAKGLLVAGGTSEDPVFEMISGLIRGLVTVEGLACLLLSLHTYVKIRRNQRA
jgi:hypothetical protein